MESKIEMIVMYLIAFNVIMSGVVSALEVIKKPLSEDHIVHKAINLIQKAVDFISANISHKK